MTESRKRRPRAARVVVNPPAPLSVLVSDKDTVIAFVEPTIKKMLRDLKKVVGNDIEGLARAGSIGDTTGQRVRNLAATLASIQSSEKTANEGPTGAENLTPDQLADKLERQAALIRGGNIDEEDL